VFRTTQLLKRAVLHAERRTSSSRIGLCSTQPLVKATV
jgi:hypothetical protein